jgi:hypothetical protein
LRDELELNRLLEERDEKSRRGEEIDWDEVA